MQPNQPELCPLCGNANQCGLATARQAAAPCWCFSTPVSKAALARVPAEQIDKACLCPNCAAGLEAAEPVAADPARQRR
ncbi:Cysteine-rich CWC [Halopseudomonas sabulinigri]|uniref:Cysteine-rich CWC n=1 Tax=Halopseudomonas sabulinigri TaxID=472181 RepID=A0A1H1UYR1_9GAMM|nr:cysteine-rich CWC family protein [Halopseudomonas sabulinigri]SDS77652.1 Cysteine-rich CWC [Halopseudomonas sabulinigri]